MKNAMKYTSKFKAFFLTVLILFPFAMILQAQESYEQKLTFESDFTPDGTVDLTNRSFDAEIKTWGNSSIELQMDVKIKAKNREDIDKTIEAIKSIEFEKRNSNFYINTVFWESMVSNTNHKIKLITGEKVVLKDFEIQITLFVPKTISMNLDNKYADIKMDEIAGGANLKIYSGKLYAESFGEAVKMELRYSKAFLKNLPEANLELYDSDIEMATCGNLDLKSKYSKIEVGRTGDFTFDSYDDKINLGDLGVFAGTAKYSDFVTGTSEKLDFDLYDCNLKTGKTGDAVGQSKYGEFEIGGANTVTLSSSYDDTFTFGPIEGLECNESKYSDFEIEWLKNSLKLESYDDNLKIEKVSPSFSQISIQGKYGDYRISIPEPAQCRLLIDMKYGKIDYPEEKFQRKTYINDNNQLFLDANSKNSTEAVTGIIEIKGYDNRIFIND